MEPDELTVEVRYRGRLLDRWALPVPEGHVQAFLGRLRDAFYAGREALRTSDKPAGELRAERIRIAAMAERSREQRAARKHLATRARQAFDPETQAWLQEREAVRREADAERRRAMR